MILSVSLSTISGVFASWNTTVDSGINVKYRLSQTLIAPSTFKERLNTLSGSTTITEILFDFYTEESLEIIENAGGSVSVDVNSSGGIIAYSVPNDSGNTIYILSEGWIYTGSDCSNMFSGFTAVKSIVFNNFDTSNATNMSGMFYNCSALTTLDVSCFKTNKVTCIYQMFRSCKSLTALDVSNFEFDNALTGSGSVFNGCSSLKTLKMPTKKIYVSGALSHWFYQCSSLTTVDVSCIDTSSVTEMLSVFSGCGVLSNIVGLEYWDTSKVTNMGTMFYGCAAKELKVENWNVSKVKLMGSMFQYCTQLTSLDLSKWTNSVATSFYCLFAHCSRLTSINISGFKPVKVANMSSMFHYCLSLKTIYVSDNWCTDAVTSSTNMFYSCRVLVGQNGTVFNSSYTDATYARVDEEGSPGYFTLAN